MGADCKPDGAHRQPDARSEEEQGGKSGIFQPVYSERKGLPESAAFRSAGRLYQRKELNLVGQICFCNSIFR